MNNLWTAIKHAIHCTYVAKHFLQNKTPKQQQHTQKTPHPHPVLSTHVKIWMLDLIMSFHHGHSDSVHNNFRWKIFLI